MGLGRRKVGIDDPSAWVFNRMADAYGARPPYPPALVDALAKLAGPLGARIVDVGAGIGHLALPLAERGFAVTAVEPAIAMLERLRESAATQGLSVRALHATAEALPLDDQSCELAVIADAMHFLDAERTGLELRRVLVKGGALAIITCELADTPYMRSLVAVMEQAAPRRPRVIAQNIAQVAALAEAPLCEKHTFHDAVAVDHDALERILRSISFIGPAMNAERFAAFRARVYALPEEPVWARTFTLRAGRRG